MERGVLRRFHEGLGLRTDHRVKNRFKGLLRLRVRQKALTHRGSVHRAVFGHELGSERLPDRGDGDASGGGKFAGDGVGVDDGDAELSEGRRRGGLPAADAAGEAETNHCADSSEGREKKGGDKRKRHRTHVRCLFQKSWSG